jgi:ankyrin repeat protein
MAKLLESRGARPPVPPSLPALDPAAELMLAVQRDRADLVRDLLDRGVSPDATSAEHGDDRPLHTAAYWGSVAAARVLLDRGAEVDPRESSYGATPLGFAVWAQRQGMIDLLGPLSRDLWNLAFTGQVERLRELLEAEPALATSAHPDGETPIMRLTDDAAKAVEIVKLFLAHGADRGVRNEQGQTAADLAGQRGMEDVVRLLT